MCWMSQTNWGLSDILAHCKGLFCVETVFPRPTACGHISYAWLTYAWAVWQQHWPRRLNSSICSGTWLQYASGNVKETASPLLILEVQASWHPCTPMAMLCKDVRVCLLRRNPHLYNKPFKVHWLVALGALTMPCSCHRSLVLRFFFFLSPQRTQCAQLTVPPFSLPLSILSHH